jgi:hypothetical protein
MDTARQLPFIVDRRIYPGRSPVLEKSAGITKIMKKAGF